MNDRGAGSNSPSRSGVASSSCSQAQARFWYEEQLTPGTSVRNVFARWRLEGDVARGLLNEAWNILVGRHESLRTRFINDDGAPMQIVEPTVDFHVHEIDLTLLAGVAAEAEAERIAALEALKPFDVTVAPLIRVTHVRLRERTSLLLVTVHHIVADGWSLGILAREMGTVVQALEARRPLELAAPGMRYTDWVTREREHLDRNDFSAEKTLLAARMAGYRPFELPLDRPRPALQTAHADIATRLLDRELTESLAMLGRSNHATLFMVSYAALLALFYRATGETDISISTQVTGRDDVDIEQTVGTFVNSIPLRTGVDGTISFVELLDRAVDTVSDALELRNVPLGTVVELLSPKRDLSRTTLFSVNFIFQRSFIANASYGPFRLIDLPSRTVGAGYDACFFLVERPEGWRLSCEYNTDLFDSTTIDSLLERYEAVFRSVVRDPIERIADITLPKAVKAAGRAALPTAIVAAKVGDVAQRSDTKREVMALVADLLGTQQIQPDDDIFGLGFHSLLAMRFLSRIKALRGVDLTLRTLFENPTVAGLAAKIDELQAPSAPALEPIVLLNANGTRAPLFFFHNDLTAEGLYCRRLATLVGADQPLYAIAPHGTSGLPVFDTVEAMALDALPRIRAIQPTGPYRLGGYCIGGLVAYEVARMLAAEGERVERVVLVNSVALPERSIRWLDTLVRNIGSRAGMSRKLRAQLCYNLAWLQAVLVSGPIGGVKLIGGRFTKLRQRREPVWQMTEFTPENRVQTEIAVAAVNAAAFTYHLKPYSGDVTLIWGQAQDVRGDVPASEWRSVARNVRLLLMNGGRSGPLNEHIEEFAAVLGEALHG